MCAVTGASGSVGVLAGASKIVEVDLGMSVMHECYG